MGLLHLYFFRWLEILESGLWLNVLSQHAKTEALRFFFVDLNPRFPPPPDLKREKNNDDCDAACTAAAACLLLLNSSNFDVSDEEEEDSKYFFFSHPTVVNTAIYTDGDLIIVVLIGLTVMSRVST